MVAAGAATIRVLEAAKRSAAAGAIQQL